MKKWFAYGGVAASIVLVAFGIGAIGIGIAGLNDVRDEIAEQNIVAGDDALTQITERDVAARSVRLSFQYNFGKAPKVRRPRPDRGEDLERSAHLLTAVDATS